jgi:hypothetical protein
MPLSTTPQQHNLYLRDNLVTCSCHNVHAIILFGLQRELALLQVLPLSL